ncbi:MAG: DEAD/DEAH box helicase family protein, partial [Pontiellaceae bacterium]|nr:DEAD/DEAH box helicase family protein [Pontiellaceae bacterium]
MPSIAKVVVEISLDREFDYRIPAHLRAQIKVGSQVVVPFNGRELRGFVVGLANHSPYGDKLKEITGAVGKKPLIPDPIMKLAYWIADYYCAPIEHAVRTVLPSAVRKRGAKHKKQLVVSLSVDARLNVDGASSSVISNKQAHSVYTTELEAPSTNIYTTKQDASSTIKLSPKQQQVIDTLQQFGPLTLTELKERAGCSDSPIRTLEKNGRVKIEESTIQRDPHAGVELLRTEPLALMPEQKTALQTICAAMDREKPGSVLLHGVTGSGKTEVYLQAIQHAREQNQGAIVLVPEIALTPQTVDRFRARFGDCVAVLHSSLSEGERHDEWHRIRSGEAHIAIGARSALFA